MTFSQGREEKSMFKGNDFRLCITVDLYAYRYVKEMIAVLLKNSLFIEWKRKKALNL